MSQENETSAEAVDQPSPSDQTSGHLKSEEAEGRQAAIDGETADACPYPDGLQAAAWHIAFEREQGAS